MKQLGEKVDSFTQCQILCKNFDNMGFCCSYDENQKSCYYFQSEMGSDIAFELHEIQNDYYKSFHCAFSGIIIMLVHLRICHRIISCTFYCSACTSKSFNLPYLRRKAQKLKFDFNNTENILKRFIISQFATRNELILKHL